MKKILYVADEGIGNTIMATPVVPVLKSLYPDCRITFGTRAGSMTIPIGLADDIIDVTKEHGKYEYDMILCSAWHYYFLKRKHKYKFKYFDRVEFKLPVKEHESDINMRLVKKLGYKGKKPPTYCHTIMMPHLFPNGVKPYICFVNGCVGSPWERKEWPNDLKFLKLISKKIQVLILGGKRERERNRYKDSNNILNLCGSLPIDECAWLMKNSVAVISNDTGLGHVGAAVGANMLMLWGPTSLLKNKPLGPNVKFLMNEKLDCLQCQYTARWDRCRDYRCLSEITPDVVYNKLLEILKI